MSPLEAGEPRTLNHIRLCDIGHGAGAQQGVLPHPLVLMGLKTVSGRCGEHAGMTVPSTAAWLQCCLAMSHKESLCLCPQGTQHSYVCRHREVPLSQGWGHIRVAISLLPSSEGVSAGSRTWSQPFALPAPARHPSTKAMKVSGTAGVPRRQGGWGPWQAGALRAHWVVLAQLHLQGTHMPP